MKPVTPVRHATILVEGHVGSYAVPVKVIEESEKRYKILFLENCNKARRGEKRVVSKALVTLT